MPPMSCLDTISNGPSSHHIQQTMYGDKMSQLHPIPSLQKYRPCTPMDKQWHRSMLEEKHLSSTFSACPQRKSLSTLLRISYKKGELWTSSSQTVHELKFRAEYKTFSEASSLTIGKANPTIKTRTSLKTVGDTSRETSSGT